MSNLEADHLKLLFENRDRAQQRAHEYTFRLEDFVLALKEGGTSYRQIAETLGIGQTTVQRWAENAQRRRDES